ncbi:MAG: hypothetical protein ABIJ27_02320 [Candidatus Omnitrophota bacterium]
MKRVFLIIGAGVEHVLAYKLAKKMGLRVVETDMNPGAPAFKFTDDCLIASTRDAKKTLEAVMKYNSKTSLSKLVCRGDCPGLRAGQRTSRQNDSMR